MTKSATSGNMILFANRSLRKLTGFLSGDLVGKPMSRLILEGGADDTPETPIRVHQKLQRCFMEGSDGSFRLYINRNNAPPMLCHLSLSALKDVGRRVVNFIGTVTVDTNLMKATHSHQSLSAASTRD